MADLQTLETKLDALFKKMQDITPVLDELGEIGLESIFRNFDEGGRTGTGILGGGMGKWKPAARGGKTLFDKGSLRGSIHYTRQGNALVWATSHKSAAAHNFGATIRPVKGKYLIFNIGAKKIFALMVKLPQREFMVLQDADLEDMEDVIVDYYDVLVKNA